MNDKLKTIKESIPRLTQVLSGNFYREIEDSDGRRQVVSVRVEIRIERLPNIPADHYRYINC